MCLLCRTACGCVALTPRNQPEVSWWTFEVLTSFKTAAHTVVAVKFVSDTGDTVDARSRVAHHQPALSAKPERRRSGQTGEPRRSRFGRFLLWSILVLLLGAVGVAGWALDRYVIDHVEINDVHTYESNVKGENDEPLTTFGDSPTSTVQLAPPLNTLSRQP